jgi:hypothetical protein
MRRARQRQGESKHGFVLAGMREERDEDDLVRRYFDEGVSGLSWAGAVGPIVGLLGGLHGQVSPGKVFSPLFYFLFSVLYFLFESDLNSNLNCRVLVMLIELRCSARTITSFFI